MGKQQRVKSVACRMRWPLAVTREAFSVPGRSCVVRRLLLLAYPCEKIRSGQQQDSKLKNSVVSDKVVFVQAET
jgi:hypothetical protein